jgi:hypothetical protein
MSHFAKVENGIVTQVIVAEQDVIDSGAFGTGWVQTSYNTYGGQHPEGRPLRKNYAGIGYTYDSARDAFYAPQPYASWTLNDDTCIWSAPTPMPTEGGPYMWDEATVSWVVYTLPEVTQTTTDTVNVEISSTDTVTTNTTSTDTVTVGTTLA